MYPLHPGHPGPDTASIVLLAAVVLAAAFALTLEGRSRAKALLGTAVLAGGSRAVVALVGLEATAWTHIAGHALEVSAVVALGLACAHVLGDGAALSPSER